MHGDTELRHGNTLTCGSMLCLAELALPFKLPWIQRGEGRVEGITPKAPIAYNTTPNMYVPDEIQTSCSKCAHLHVSLCNFFKGGGGGGYLGQKSSQKGDLDHLDTPPPPPPGSGSAPGLYTPSPDIARTWLVFPVLRPTPACGQTHSDPYQTA